MGELELICAQTFRKKGKTKMGEKDFVMALAFDFKWFTPKEAQRLLEICLDSGVLRLDSGFVYPTFDYKNFEIPRGYVPSKDILQKPIAPKEAMLDLIEEMTRKSGKESKDVIALVNKVQDALGVEVEAAALVVARDMGIDISVFIDRVEEGLGEKCRKSHKSADVS